MNEMGEGSVLIGVGKPEMKVPLVVEPATVSTPEQLVDEVVKSSTKQQMGDLLRDFLKLGKDYYAKIGKAIGGVAVHEGVKTLQGARELKLKEAAQADGGLVSFKERTTKKEGRKTFVLSEEEGDIKKGISRHAKYSVHDNPDGSKTELAEIYESPILDENSVEDGKQKKGFWGNAEKAYKEGSKYNLSQEAKNKQAEAGIHAIGNYVTDTVLQPYPDVPRPITALADAASSFMPNKGIEFIPAVLQILKADLDVAKTGVALAKRFREIIRNSPEAQGSKGDMQTAFKVARNLIKDKIDQTKQPKVQEAVLAFA